MGRERLNAGTRRATLSPRAPSGKIEGVGARQTQEGHAGLLRELNEERVATLTRITRTLESLIEQLQEVRRQLEAGGAGGAARHHAQYDALRERALRYRWYLEVQREALGLRHHACLDEFYVVPGPISSSCPGA